jgi:steroid delta-isomerase-like uncharacterized protein
MTACSTAAAAATGIDRTFLTGWTALFLNAWNALDGEAVAALCTEDVVWCDPSSPEPFTGRSGVREFVQTTARAFPDFSVTETAPPYFLPDRTRVLSPYQMTGTMLGPINVFAPTGCKISVAGVDQWTFQDGHLCHYDSYYDTLEVARQLGIMPRSGSRAEWLMARAQHAQAGFQRRRARAGQP